MKKISLVITLVFLCSIGVGVVAQTTTLPDPGMTPDHPLYFIEKIVEGIGDFFTFGDLKKAERYATLATERLAEAKAVAEKGKHELVEKTLARYEKQLNKSINRAKKAQAKPDKADKAAEILTKVGEATSKHLEVLAEVYDKVPEQAKAGIENAMGASVKGHEKAVEALKAKGRLGKVPEEVSLPGKVPEETRQRIQRQAKMQASIEEALALIEPFDSIQAFCIAEGGPPEVCATLPDKDLKSFKEIEKFCVEMGAPPELCPTLEVECKKMGITKAEQCFRSLFVAATTAYNSAAPTSVPQPEVQRGAEQGGMAEYQTDEGVVERRRVGPEE